MTTTSNHLELPLDHPDSIILPAVKVDFGFRKVGRIRAILAPEEVFDATRQHALPHRRTRTANVISNTSLRELLVTTTKTDREHQDYPEILLEERGKFTWLKNKTAISAQAAIQGEEPSQLRNEIRLTWTGAFIYRDATIAPDGRGLRPPQIGALHATLAHWTLSNEPVTVVMPTGTGKTETMLALLIAAQPKCMLVVVPSKALRDQTANKFETLGILPAHGLLTAAVRTPIVGILEHQVGSTEALSIFDRCNVVIAVIDSIAKGNAKKFLNEIAHRCSHLILDEAHHVAATSWADLKMAFAGILKVP